MQILNFTPFEVDRFAQIAADGEERLLVLVKCTLRLDQGRPRLHEMQEPIRLVDEWNGEPGLSSVKRAGEGALFKPAADLILIGHAYATGRDRTVIDVRLRVEDRTKVVRVYGDRHWYKTLGMVTVGKPAEFDRMPLVYERAFGGIDESDSSGAEMEARNPVGIGFRAKRSARPVEKSLLPNLEDSRGAMRRPEDRPAPAGFGFIAPHWSPRVERAGTYDESWQQSRAPLLPTDFDPLHWQAAPLDQIHPGYFKGGEAIEAENASPSGRVAFRLPQADLEVEVRVGDETLTPQMNMDTVVIDGDTETATLLWRGSVGIHNRVYQVEWVRFDGDLRRA